MIYEEELFDPTIYDPNEDHNGIDGGSGYQEEEYAHYYQGTGYQVNSFRVIDGWDTNRYPQLTIIYELNNNSYYLYLDFNGDNYRYINHYVLIVNGKRFYENNNCDLTIDYFLNVDDTNKILAKSEEKCIRIINKLLAMKAFI